MTTNRTFDEGPQEDENAWEAEVEEYRRSDGTYSFSPDDDEDSDPDDLDSYPELRWEEDLDELDDPIPVASPPRSPAPTPFPESPGEQRVRQAPENRLEFDGKGWEIRYADKSAQFRNLDGLLYMSYVLERPGPVGVRLLDIEMLVNARLEPDDEDSDQAGQQDAEALLVSAGFEDEEPDEAMLRSISYSEANSTEDRETLEGYRLALKQLNRELGITQGGGDQDYARHVQAQINEIKAELRQVEQRTKRGPENEGPSKGHITRIRNAINYAKDTAIGKSLPELAEHLQQYLVCESNTAVYNPPSPLRWAVRRAE